MQSPPQGATTCRDHSISSPTPPPKTATACPRCGVIDTPQRGPGLPPHYFRATCAHCGAFLRWVSRYTPEERAARRAQARTQGMRGLAVTTPQRAYLTRLGYRGAPPADRAEASVLIDTLLQKKGGAA